MRSLDSVLDRNLYITQHGISPGYTGTVADANHTAIFVFSGLTGVTEADIASEVMFSLGTQPDSTAFVPEPGTAPLLGMGLLGLASRLRSLG